MVQEHRLQIEASTQNIEAACKFVTEIARSSNMDDESIHHCYLAVEEICVNIIEHGYHLDNQDGIIIIVCRQYPNHLSITFIDNANQFNPLLQPTPNPKTPLWERKKGGWGIYFVKKYMDRISYQFQQNHNHLTIEKDFIP